MLCINIPGRGDLELEHLVLDYNGTIAQDGRIIDGITERLELLKESLNIMVITADTHGTAGQQCRELPLTVKTYPSAQVAQIKAEEVKKLKGGVVSIGNGFNDILMADASLLSVAVIGREGCCGSLLSHTDVVVTSITDALDLLLQTHRLRATLRT